MRRFTVISTLLLSMACAAQNRLVYSQGFTFANYDYVVVAKPGSEATSTTLYGFDIEFANLLSQYNMNVVGEAELDNLAPSDRERVLLARVAVTATDNRIVLSVSFDDLTTGKTGASVTAYADGDIFDLDDRGEAFESASETLIKALQRDRGLTVTLDDGDSDKAPSESTQEPEVTAESCPVDLGIKSKLTDDRIIVTTSTKTKRIKSGDELVSIQDTPAREFDRKSEVLDGTELRIVFIREGKRYFVSLPHECDD